jgi:hypothetical protein
MLEARKRPASARLPAFVPFLGEPVPDCGDPRQPAIFKAGEMRIILPWAGLGMSARNGFARG